MPVYTQLQYSDMSLGQFWPNSFRNVSNDYAALRKIPTQFTQMKRGQLVDCSLKALSRQMSSYQAVTDT